MIRDEFDGVFGEHIGEVFVARTLRAPDAGALAGINIAVFHTLVDALLVRPVIGLPTHHVEAFIEVRRGVFVAQIPFANQASHIPRLFERLRHRLMALRKFDPLRPHIPPRAKPVLVGAGHQAHAAGRTHRRRHIPVGETDARCGELVNRGRRHKTIARVTGRVAVAQVVDKDQDDVRLGRGLRALRVSVWRKERQGQGEPGKKAENFHWVTGTQLKKRIRPESSEIERSP